MSSVIAVRLGRLPETGRPVVDKTALKVNLSSALIMPRERTRANPISSQPSKKVGIKAGTYQEFRAEFVVIDNIEKPSLEN